MVFLIMMMRCGSSWVRVLYMFIRSHGWSGWFVIWIIWKNNDVFAGLEMLERLHGIVCMLWLSVSSHSMALISHALACNLGGIVCVVKE